MRAVYRDVFRQVLPALRTQVFVTTETTIIAPNLDEEFMAPLRSARTVLPITAEANPLFAATGETLRQTSVPSLMEARSATLASMPFVSVLL